ncbi:hypothetical protein KM043_017824 [Ampulex compressa]|nr:hypothetical protein KM043_017824 [Ampulex compressa]
MTREKRCSVYPCFRGRTPTRPRCEGGIGSSTCYRHYHQASTPENTGSKETRFESNFCLRLQYALVARRRAVQEARSDLLCPRRGGHYRAPVALRQNDFAGGNSDLL